MKIEILITVKYTAIKINYKFTIRTHLKKIMQHFLGLSGIPIVNQFTFSNKYLYIQHLGLSILLILFISLNQQLSIEKLFILDIIIQIKIFGLFIFSNIYQI